MDKPSIPTDQLLFHLTGRCAEGTVLGVAGLDLRPALLAPYRDLGALRHDFPLVLAPAGTADFAVTLSDLVDRLIREVAPRGAAGERLRRHALQLETEIRRAIDVGAEGMLSELWQAAVARLGRRAPDDVLEQVLLQAGSALAVDGPVLGCTVHMPAQLLTQAWRAACRERARAFRADLSRLVLQLSDILRAARSHSKAGRAPEALKAALGGAHREAFDFEALSRFVGKAAPQDELPPARRARLERTLATLEQQRFFATGDDEAAADAAWNFAFDDCAAAAQAFAERLPALAELVKALSIAELEIQGRYDEAEHDLFFAAFDAHMLGADDLARFPDYLVCVPPGRADAPENTRLMELLSAGLPLKVLVLTEDLQEDAAIGTGHFAFGVRSSRLATTAMGLGGLFVLQTPASNLVALRPQLARGMGRSGPALFSVYAAPARQPVPAYLRAAAALDSRAFPAFCYDALAGANWAERFSLLNNPQPEADWPVRGLAYADAAQQACRLDCAFTTADFLLCDTTQAAHFACVPQAHWNEAMVPAADWLRLPDAEAARRVPYLLAVDAEDRLQRVIVDLRVMQATRRSLLLWHRLQEHGGINDSHAQRLLERERAAWMAASAAAAPSAAAPVQAATAPAAAPAPAEPAPEAAAQPAHSRDEAWIETARCPSCNECQNINDRMFAYNDRKQAYIKDITAGTYRQMVEAAEGCQVAIIHPGAPRDPTEPGLEELLARAEPFR